MASVGLVGSSDEESCTERACILQDFPQWVVSSCTLPAATEDNAVTLDCGVDRACMKSSRDHGGKVT